MKRMHKLKLWPAPFAASWGGKKRYEVRQDDRGFAVGDLLVLQEFDPGDGTYLRGRYTGRALCVAITYKTGGGTWGMPPNLCVLSVDELARTETEGSVVGFFDQYARETP